jgi:hypothetical protein
MLARCNRPVKKSTSFLQKDVRFNSVGKVRTCVRSLSTKGCDIPVYHVQPLPERATTVYTVTKCVGVCEF